MPIPFEPSMCLDFVLHTPLASGFVVLLRFYAQCMLPVAGGRTVSGPRRAGGWASQTGKKLAWEI